MTSGAVTLGTIAFSLVLLAFDLPLFAAVASIIIPGVLSYWAGENLDPKYISVKKWEYVHKDKGFNVSSHMSVLKRKIKLYPTKDYTGKSKYTKDSFQVFKY